VSDDRAPAKTLTALLARLRVPLGFVSAVLVFWLARPTGVLILSGLIVALPGELLRVWAAGHLVKSSEVTSSGPYRWFAHPLYVGSSTMGVGLAVASGSLAAAILIALYLTVTIGAAIRSEEAFLRRRFGDHYGRYRDAGVVDEGARRFSLERAIGNREHRAVAGFAAALLLLALKATYNGMFWRTAGGRFVGPGG
jgi:protein-S-isoprenylcysteine O-methyltransferase Ste14